MQNEVAQFFLCCCIRRRPRYNAPINPSSSSWWTDEPMTYLSLPTNSIREGRKKARTSPYRTLYLVGKRGRTLISRDSSRRKKSSRGLFNWIPSITSYRAMTVYCIEPPRTLTFRIYNQVYMNRSKQPMEFVYQGYVHALRIQRQVEIQSLEHQRQEDYGIGEFFRLNYNKTMGRRSIPTEQRKHVRSFNQVFAGDGIFSGSLSELGTTLSYLVLEFPRLFPIEVLVGQVLFGRIQLRARLCWLEGPGGSSKLTSRALLNLLYKCNRRMISHLLTNILKWGGLYPYRTGRYDELS